MADSWAKMIVPFAWLRGYQPSWARWDLLAGVTAAAVVIPQAMAYASIATVPVEAGIACALLPAVAYAAFGTARALSVSTTSSIAILTAAVIADQAGSDPLATATSVALLAGVMLVVAGILRLGFLADFVSVPVLTGFKAGMGLLIIAGQLGRVLGIEVDGNVFFDQVFSALGNLGDVDLTTVALAAGTMVVVFALLRWTPQLPAPLIGLGLGLALVAVAGLEQHGVSVIDPIPTGLPELDVPSLSESGGLLAGAAGIALIVLVESSAAARAFRKRDDPPLDLDRELIGLGVANFAAGVTSAIPAGGGLSQTAVNDRAGARSQGAGLVVAAVAALTLLFLAPVFDNLAEATLGALVIVAASSLIDAAGLTRIYRLRRRDFGLAAAALGGVLLFGSLQGVLIGVLLSVLVLFYEANRPPLLVLGRRRGTADFRDHAAHPDDETWADLLILRPLGTIYFANARRLLDRELELINERHAPPRAVLVDYSAVPDADVTAMDLGEGLHAELSARGIKLWVAGLQGPLLEMTRRSPLWDRAVAEGRIFDSVQDAVEHWPDD
jgi:SulP family sulfate permease